MSDRRRIVTISSAGTVTTVKDLEDTVAFFAVAGSFQVKAPERRTIMAASARRYGGSRAASETHDNGEITWKALVLGTTQDQVIQNVEAMLGVLESPRDYFFEWRPDGTTNSTFFEIRGPAKWQPTYSWAQFAGGAGLYVDITIPAAPLSRGAASAIAIPSTSMPAVVALASAVLGDAPALADIALTTTGGTSPPIWAYLGWTKRPAAPLASSVAPFGIIEAETGASLSTWAVTADATYRGGSGLKATAAGIGSASAMFPVDPSVMQPDDFAAGEVDIEVWAVMDLAAGLVSPKVVLSLQPFAGLNFGAEQFAAEYGSFGKLLTKPSTGSARRPVKLGTLTMPVDVAAPLKWNVKVAASWGAASTGVCGLDYLWLAPARQRALSPTGEPNDASYPDFIASTGATTKTVRSDLSGRVASGAGNPGRDTGLGGSLLELPPGTVDLLVVLSSVVPDDPTSNTTTMQLAHTGVTGSVVVTPRYWLARGT